MLFCSENKITRFHNKNSRERIAIYHFIWNQLSFYEWCKSGPATWYMKPIESIIIYDTLCCALLIVWEMSWGKFFARSKGVSLKFIWQIKELYHCYIFYAFYKERHSDLSIDILPFSMRLQLSLEKCQV